MTNASPANTFTFNAPSGVTEMCAINASGNVTINETFENVAQSTITMTGDSVSSPDPTGLLAVRKRTGSPDDVKLGNFVVNGASVKINSHVIFAGSSVTIEAKKVLTTSPNAYIQLNPLLSPSTPGGPAFTWLQEKDTLPDVDHGKFDSESGNTPIVEFGIQGYTPPGRIFVIDGNTTWYDLVCREPKATLKFSNYSDTHSVAGEFLAMPLNEAGNALEGGGGAVSNQYMIELTRLNDDNGTTPSVPPNDDTQPPPSVTDDFWYFDLKSDATLDFNYVYIHYSWAKNHIPVPTANDKLILAIYYVCKDPLNYALSKPRGISDPDDFAKAAYYDHNWLVADNFFYSFTEDSDGNGRIDRIRAQAAFDLTGGAGSFSDFKVEVNGYEVDTSKGHNGYHRVDEAHSGAGLLPDVLASMQDMIYIYLKEKDYSDTGARPVWRVGQNTTLKDNATKSIELTSRSNSFPDGLMPAWDTAPPRINYALTLPALIGREGSPRGEIYVQFSEPVEIAAIAPTLPASPPLAPGSPESAPGSEDSAIILPLNGNYGLVDLVSPPSFVLEHVQDKAEYVEDFRSQASGPGSLYPYLFPSPKYPVNWEYNKYKEIKGNSAPFNTVPPSATGVTTDNFPIKSWNATSGNLLNNGGAGSSPPYGEDTHRVTDVLISAPPAALTDSSYFVWPIWAKYKEPANFESLSPGNIPWLEKPTDTGIIWQFNGKKYLEAEDIDLQVHRNSSLSGDPAIWFGFNVPDTYRARAISGGYGHGNPGLWLPKDSSSGFVNLVPDFYNVPPLFAGRGNGNAAMNITSPYYGYRFTKSGDGYTSPAMLDFFFHLYGSPADLFAARLDINPGAAIPPNWYQLVRPFSFEIHDITRQRSGVTILNNVINPNNGESTYVHYQLVRGGQVTIQVFTLDGTMVDILYRGHRDAGEYRAVWGGKNRGGRAVARGMYFVRVVGPDIDEIRKVMVVK
jgi:hypothetical protein